MSAEDARLTEALAEVDRVRAELESARRTWRLGLSVTVAERDRAREALAAVAALAKSSVEMEQKSLARTHGGDTFGAWVGAQAILNLLADHADAEATS